ncbi:SDR family oxidoreductase [Actinoplanes teichomyceticus]|uniref:SDR family oxidoreductase n=1 Tax=Actinoplanes teichomyceticus TaxID=1867 RepID=UPI001A3B277E|nr:SDR family oxidoreductase [Actinoplanes teichomyceticus]GIF16258.1 hypothetical protein Ate01nite_62900 [Actinoplanes teichomyceticus]
MTRADDVAGMVAAVHDRFGHIDVLVANAHMHFRHRPFLEYEWADLDRRVSDELKAILHPCRAVAPEKLRRRSGSIIAISSTCSKRSNDGFLAQSTAKAAVDAFVRSLATELGPHGVRVNTVAPGLTLTDAAMPMAPHVKESIAARSPMRRNGLPEDMAGAVIFLASDLSRFMTGTYLPVDGGFTMLQRRVDDSSGNDRGGDSSGETGPQHERQAPRHRQLRLVHLQPRPDVPELRPRDLRGPRRRARRGRRRA